MPIRLTDLQKQRIKELRSKGIGYRRIAHYLGINYNTVKKFCQRNGISGFLGGVHTGDMPDVLTSYADMFFNEDEW